MIVCGYWLGIKNLESMSDKGIIPILHMRKNGSYYQFS